MNNLLRSNKKRVTDILTGIPLFSHLSKEEINTTLEKAELNEYAKGMAVDLNNNRLYIIIKGVLLVNFNNITVRTLKKGDITGVSGLFTNENPKAGSASVLSVSKQARVLAIGKMQIHKLLLENPEFNMEYIVFLTDRIRFLNSEMLYYTTQNAKKRLISYLIKNSKGDNTFIPINMSKLASLLNMGRATLYRLMAELEENDVIKRENRGLTIISENKLVCLLNG